jgi:adenylyltransferase/sulfurtransferase
MTERDYQLLNLRYSCPLLRREEILEGKVPTAPTIASMMAALEVQEALKLIHGLPVAAGSALVFNGVTNQFYTTRLPVRDDCLSHETFPEPVEVPIGREDPVSSLFEKARPTLDGQLSLALERDLVVSIECPRCGWRAEVLRPRTSVRQAEAICPTCREPGRPEIVHAIEEDSPLARLPLARVGVPSYDIVRIDGESESGFFLLAADRDGRASGWGMGDQAGSGRS